MPVNGTKGAFIQASVYGQDQSGAYTQETYRGTRDEIQAKIAEVILAGASSYEVKEGFNIDELTARYPASRINAETPVDDWELFYNTVEKDVLESDLAVVLTLTAKDKKLILSALEDPTWQSPSLSSGDATLLYLEMVAGFRSVPVDVPTLRWTRTVSKAYDLANEQANAGKILSTGTLLGLPIPNQVKNQMPSGGAVAFADGTTKHYGWRKGPPTPRTALFQKTQLVQEWVFGLYSQIAYGVPI